MRRERVMASRLGELGTSPALARVESPAILMTGPTVGDASLAATVTRMVATTEVSDVSLATIAH